MSNGEEKPMEAQVQIDVAVMKEHIGTIKETMQRLEGKLDKNSETYVTAESMIFRDREVKDMKDTLKWLWRTAFSALILSPIGALISGVFMYFAIKGNP